MLLGRARTPRRARMAMGGDFGPAVPVCRVCLVPWRRGAEAPVNMEAATMVGVDDNRFGDTWSGGGDALGTGIGSRASSCSHLARLPSLVKGATGLVTRGVVGVGGGEGEGEGGGEGEGDAGGGGLGDLAGRSRGEASTAADTKSIVSTCLLPQQ